MRLTQRLTIRYIRTKFKLLSAISKRKAARKAFQLFITPQSRTRKRKLPDIFRKAEKLRFEFEGFTIHGFRWNHPSDKKVLILHGYESSIVNFDQYVRPLIKMGYEVLGFDAPAHGRSTGRQITVLIYREFIRHVSEKFGPITCFIAHSFGGLALSQYLETVPDTSEYKAVFIAPATETKSAVEHYFQLLQLDGEIRREFDQIIIEKGGHPAEWFSVARACENFRARVLWLHDKDDRQTPFADILPVMEKNYPHIRFRISQGLGHRKIYHDSQTRKTIMEFLAG